MSKNVEKKDKLAKLLEKGEKEYLVNCKAFFEGKKAFIAEAKSSRALIEALEEKFGDKFTNLRKDFEENLERIMKAYTEGVIELLRESGEYKYNDRIDYPPEMASLLEALKDLLEKSIDEGDEEEEEEEDDGDNNDN